VRQGRLSHGAEPVPAFVATAEFVVLGHLPVDGLSADGAVGIEVVDLDETELGANGDALVDLDPLALDIDT
jgi:hypothetical protein